MSATAFSRPLWALIFGVVLFLLPPIPVGGRSLFLSDYFLLLWGVFAFIELIQNKKHRSISVFAALAFFTSYLCGYWRYSLVEPLAPFSYGFGKETTDFLWLREFVIMARFASWWFIVAWLCWLKPVSHDRALRLSILKFLALFLSATIILDFPNTPMHAWLGKWYGFDPNYQYWLGRARGTLQSPVEAGSVLGLMWVALMSTLQRWNVKVIAIAMVIFIGLVLTHNGSAFIASLVAVLLPLILRGSRKIKRWFFIVAGLLILVPFIVDHSVFQQKLDDLHGRVDPWIVLIHYVFNSFWGAAFGHGMVPVAADQVGLAFLLRFGFIGTAVLLLWPCFLLAKNRKRLTSAEMSVAVYLLVCGLLLDVLLFRHTMTVLCLLVLPLVRKSSSESTI